ncbi:MAG: lysylphosphatidylglycerol synthase transmembrane domain-containing protein [Candidatus Bathycorpusculaceae bacterium]
MVSAEPKITFRTIILPVIGLIAFFIYIYVCQVDILEIISTAQRMDPAIYFLAAIFNIVEVFFFALSWRMLLSFLAVKVSIIRSYLYVWYGIFMDIIIPAESISGEISRVYLIAREQSGTSGKVLASLVAHRLMGMGLNVATLILGISMLLTEREVSGLILNLALLCAIAIALSQLLLILLCSKEKLIQKMVDGLVKLVEFVSRGRWKLTKVREYASKTAITFHGSMKEFKHAPKTLFTSLFFLAVTWIFNLSIAYLVFLALRFPVHWSTILITSSIVLAVKSVPIGVPFEVGLPEITMTTLYALLGVPVGISATVTILNRIITLWFRFFIGFVTQQWLEIKRITASTNTKGT